VIVNIRKHIYATRSARDQFHVVETNPSKPSMLGAVHWSVYHKGGACSFLALDIASERLGIPFWLTGFLSLPFGPYAFSCGLYTLDASLLGPSLAGFLSFYLRLILAVIFAFNLLHHFIDSLSLLFPFVLAHLELLLEQLVIRLPVATPHAVPERCELPVVVVEVQVVHGVTSGAVDDRRVMCVLSVVNEDRPDVHEDEERNVGELLQREQKGEDVVGQTLCVAIHGVKSVRGKRCGHDPLVVRLVQRFVHALVVQTAVNPVDTEIGEAYKKWELNPVVPRSWTLLGCIVELRVAAYFSQEPWRCKDSHNRKGDVCLLHFKLDLVLEVSWMGESCLIEDEEVGRGREDIVDEDTKQPVMVLEVDETQSFGTTDHVIRYNVSSCLRQSSRGHALSYAACEGCIEKYFEAGSCCHAAAGRAKPVGSSLMLEKVALAARGVLESGRIFEYMWSKMKASAISRTISMVVGAAESGSR
jgi:hypothetical protein